MENKETWGIDAREISALVLRNGTPGGDELASVAQNHFYGSRFTVADRTDVDGNVPYEHFDDLPGACADASNKTGVQIPAELIKQYADQIGLNLN